MEKITWEKIVGKKQESVYEREQDSVLACTSTNTFTEPTDFGQNRFSLQ